MSQPIRSIPVEHDPMIYRIEPNRPDPELSLTLLELVQAVNEVSESEQELVATVLYLLKSGRIQLAGNFRDACLDDFWD